MHGSSLEVERGKGSEMAPARAESPQPSARARRLAPTLPQLWALVTLGGIFALLGLWLVHPNDFWWHVRAGGWIVDHGRLPWVDLFSFTRAGEPWAYQSWLMEVVFYLLLRAGDLPLVIFLNAVAITAAYGLLLRVSQQAAGSDLRWAALATLAAAALGATNWNVRPQTLSILLFSLALYLVERHAAFPPGGGSRLGGDRALWWLVPLFALWANGHGGFVFGLILLGAYLLAELLAWLSRGPFPAQALAVTLLSATATLLTPLGLGMVDYLLGFLRHPVTRTQNVEFWPPTFQTLDGQLFFGFVLALVALLVASRYRLSRRESIRLLLFGGLALVARRNIIWFGFVAAPTMGAALYWWARQRGSARPARAGRPLMNAAIAMVVGVVLLLSLPWFRPHLPLPEEYRAYAAPHTPVQAVAALRDLSPPSRAFHTDGYGSYMIWASPEMPVFIDTRIELYPAEQWDDYFALTRARYNWQAILERYGIDTLLLDRDRHQSLIDAATEAPGWERTYEDEQAVIFQRRGAP